MIANATMIFRPARVPHTGIGVVRLTDAFRDEAKRELAAAMEGLTQKQVRRANVPAAGVTYLSRSKNGDDCNALFRLMCFFLLLKKAGAGRDRAQRLIDAAQGIVNWLWPEKEAELSEALEKDSALDPEDDHLRFQAVRGCMDAKRALIEVKRRQMAHAPVVVAALQRRIGEAK